MSLTDREPALAVGGLVSLFAALVTAAHAFEWIDWSPEQSGAVAALMVIILPPIQAMITRKYVTPVGRVVVQKPPAPE